MSGILTYTSVINGSVSMPTKEVLGMARAIARESGDSVTAALVGAEVSGLASELIASGADQVCICDHVSLSEFCANVYLEAIEAIIATIVASVRLSAPPVPLIWTNRSGMKTCTSVRSF